MSGTVVRIVLILLPLLLYFLWLRYRRRRQSALTKGNEAELAAAQTELAWAVGFLVILMIIGFSYLAFSTGEDPRARYIPPHMDESGRVLPGQFEIPAEPAPSAQAPADEPR